MQSTFDLLQFCRYSPSGGYSSDIKGAGGYSSTDFSSKSDISDGEGGSDGIGGGSAPRRSHSAGPHGHRVTSGLSASTPKSRAISSASTRQSGGEDRIVNGVDGAMSGDDSLNRSMPTMPPGTGTGGTRTPGSATGSLGDSTGIDGMQVRSNTIVVCWNFYISYIYRPTLLNTCCQQLVHSYCSFFYININRCQNYSCLLTILQF